MLDQTRASIKKPEDKASTGAMPNLRHPVDARIGARIKARRLSLGMSQERLGEVLGVTFQQVQKYEQGMTAIKSSRLFDIATVLEVPLSYFFTKNIANSDEAKLGASGLRSSTVDELQDRSKRRETFLLVRNFSKITDANARKLLFDFVKALAASGAA